MNPRERALLIFFVVLGTGAAVWLAWGKLDQWDRQLSRQEHTARLAETGARALLADKSRWEKRQQWLLEKQPVRTTQGADDNSFLEEIQSKAGQNNLVFKSRQFLNPEEKPGMVSSTITIQTKSTLADLRKWLYAFQQAESFVEVPNLRMEVDTEQAGAVITDLTLRKWFRLP